MIDKKDYYTNQAKRGVIILAGGDSKRLGRPKALLEVHGQPMIKRTIKMLSAFFNEITLVTDRPELYSDYPVRLTADLLVGSEKSPLRGIHAGLYASVLPYQFVVACDMPRLNLALIRFMSGFASQYDAVIPLIGTYYQPLHAYYSRGCIDPIRRQLEKGNLKVTDFYKLLRARFISEEEVLSFDPNQESFTNINTWRDYEALLSPRPEA